MDANGHLGPQSLSPLQQQFGALEAENGPLGDLLASKAFVQLAITPIIGYLTSVVDLNLLLLLGSCNMLLAALRKRPSISNNISTLSEFLFSSVCVR